MANPWFRLYSEFADDPKVQMMPESMQRRLIMLMCSKCKDETLHETQRAFHWRITLAELAETKALFIENGFIDESWNPINWNKRQFLSDSSTDRVRRHRQALKQDETLQAPNVTANGTGKWALVTAPEQNRTDTEQKHKKTIARFTSSDIESVYAEYPRKVGRGAALKAIVSALHRIDDPDPVAVLIRVTREFSRSPAGQRGEFTPHPSTFYNQSRYLDDPEEWEKVR